MEAPPARDVEAQMVEQDRRRAPRHRTLKGGLIALNGAGTIDCRVRNLSAVGACLEVAGQVGIPDQFTLLVEHDGFKQQCRAVWRTPNRLGVEFIGDRFHHDLKAPPNAIA
jgi:hypothetical protein